MECGNAPWTFEFQTLYVKNLTTIYQTHIHVNDAHGQNIHSEFETHACQESDKKPKTHLQQCAHG